MTPVRDEADRVEISGHPVRRPRGRRRWVRHLFTSRQIYQGLASGCATLPLPLLHVISAVGNTLALVAMRKTRRGLARNFENALGVRHRRARALARRVFYSYGLTTIDLFRTRVGDADRVPEIASHPRDDRVLRGMAEEGRAGLVVTGHLGNWELGAIYLALHGLPVAVMGQPEHDPRIQELRDEIRSRFGIGWIEIGSDTSTALRVRRAVSRGTFVALLVDRAYPEDAIGVEFFGRPTPFLRSPARLARFCDCPLVPCYLFRKPDGSYRSHFHEPVEIDFSLPAEEGDREAMTAVARALERGLREEPTQWYNFFDYWPRERADD